MLQKKSNLSLPHGYHYVMVVQSYSPTFEGVPASHNLISEISSFQNFLPSLLHGFFLSCYMKHSSWNVFLCSNNPGICGQTHYKCSISWCDNEKICVPLDYISNTLGCYATFHYLFLHNVFNPNLCDHIHYMRRSDYETHFHTFSLVSTLKVSLF